MLKMLAVGIVGVASGLLFQPCGGESPRVSTLEIGEPGHAGYIRLQCLDGKPTFEMLSDAGSKVSLSVDEDVRMEMGKAGKGEAALTVLVRQDEYATMMLGKENGLGVDLRSEPGRIAAVMVNTGMGKRPSAGMTAIEESTSMMGMDYVTFPGSASFCLWDGTEGRGPIAHIRTTAGQGTDWWLAKADGTTFKKGSTK